MSNSEILAQIAKQEMARGGDLLRQLRSLKERIKHAPHLDFSREWENMKNQMLPTHMAIMADGRTVPVHY